jgi:uncharacterized protein (TIGR03435 family)
MKRSKKTFPEFLEDSFAPFRELPPADVEAAWERVVESARGGNTPFVRIPSHIGAGGRLSWTTRILAAVAAAALVVSVGVTLSSWSREAAVVQRTNARLHFGDTTLSAGGGDLLLLKDGSRVEMRAHSELFLERADDGIRIHLSRGGVIVNAAKQKPGRHLYVRTKDVIVSVMGTVFLVNAEEAGTRVAVIEGEVNVQQHKSPSEKLRAGEQFATNPFMESVPVPDEVSWSRNAESHRALLQQSSPAVPKAATPLSFAVASIKPHSGSSDGIESLGFVCHGADSVRRAFPEDIGLGGRLIAPQGRCRGAGVMVQSLVALAYGVANRDVLGLPSWAIPSLGSDSAAGAFQIDAETDDPAMTTVEQLKQMLQTMLAERFKLRIHRESRQESGYALVVARNGTKPALRPGDGDEEIPSLESNNHGQTVIRGKSTMKRFAEFLNGSLGVGGVNLPVVDKTGLEGLYEFEFVRVIPGQRGGAAAAQGARPTLEELQRLRAAALSDAMEAQVGLRLQDEKAVPVEVIVVDHVEKPSAN